MTSTPPRDATRLTGTVIGVLALLTAVSPLATDMYLPAFPQMAIDLGVSATSIQLTLTTFLIGLALGQLIIGPLSDGTGRRKPLLIGTAICLLASIGTAVAPNVELLIAARFVQGLSGAAGVVLARAIISDSAKGVQAAKVLGVMMIILGIAPVLAPVLGGAIIAGLGWRGVFWVVAFLVALMFIAALCFIKETLPASGRQGGGLKAMLRSGRTVLSNRNYVGYLVTFCFAFGAMFAYISASPFVLQNVLGLSTTTYSLVFGLNALAIMISAIIATKLAGRVDFRKMLGGGVIALVLATLALLTVVFTGVAMIPTLLLLFVFQGSLGFIYGNATALALGEARQHAGTASAFLGAFQFILAGAVSPLVGLAGEHDALPMAIAMALAALISAAGFFLLTRNRSAEAIDGEAEPARPEMSEAATR
ncbi:multidrug effflux MFS transporter [Arthrobacter crystallopoietes]|uniref:MFS transporter, DHA1 family, bicyclomycin/chloramphenicol resistance protein n=1 Tax=Crystallibacter crystallopoietes TaxID=37928 RepID=A0A1H1F253_9MICC|nr:multidrug effflux MFS transporter [Arthrobacter crystallopoietes]SDQ95037.1 MFS transporter, DHA1 family, bicyclomycin/chloramphenicol resistance protein [Arthrobacter crystallopoietes]